MPRRYKGSQGVDIPVDAILRECAAWSDEIVKAVGDALLKEVRVRTKGVFENQSGALRRGIRKKGSRLDKDTHIVGAFAPHAHLVEFGTGLRVDRKGKVSGHMPASPFLGPAADAVRDRLQEIVHSVMGDLTITVNRK